MKYPFLKTATLLLFACTCRCSTMAQQTDSVSNTIGLNYEFFSFEKPSALWQIASLEWTHQTKKNTWLGRLSHGSRLERKGTQVEVDYYPKFTAKTYGYFSVGYSPDMPVFAKFRAAASLFVGLNRGWEAEGGLRQLYFDKSIWIGTAGLARYAGHWYLQARTFQSPAAAGWNHSYFITSRYYFGEKNNYAWLQLGSGISPDDNRNIQFGGDFQLHSRRISSGLRFFAGKAHIVQLSLGYSRDEVQKDLFSNQYFGNIGYGYRF